MLIADESENEIMLADVMTGYIKNIKNMHKMNNNHRKINVHTIITPPKTFFSNIWIFCSQVYWCPSVCSSEAARRFEGFLPKHKKLT